MSYSFDKPTPAIPVVQHPHPDCDPFEHAFLSDFGDAAVRLHRTAKALGWHDLADAFLAAAGVAATRAADLTRAHGHRR